MSDKTSVQAVNKNRKKKLALEKSLIQALALLWREMDDELSNDYTAAAYEVSAAYENLKPPRYELMGLSSYIGMIAHLRSRYDNFIDSAAETIAGYQQQAYHLGISGAQEALDELELDDDWYRMPATEMDSRTGVSSNGIRIGDILRNGMNHVVAGLTSALIAGATFGKTPEQIVLDMKQSATSGLDQAITTGRTEYNRAHREALTEQYRQSGAIAGFRRMAYKPTACFACLMLDGEWLEKESDLEDHPNGRCMAVPFRSKDAPIPWQTGADWFLAQDAEKQMRILGKGRYEAWKAGEIPSLRDIVYIKQNEMWGGCPTVIPLKEITVNNSVSSVIPLLERNPYETAKRLDGKHHGFYKRNIELPISLLEKGRRRLALQIEKHEDKIARMNKIINDDKYFIVNERSAYGLLLHWHKEIVNFAQQRDILDGIIKEKERG